MDKKQERRGLGRGLSALMADVNLSGAPNATPNTRRGETIVAVELLFPNPNQPRRDFSEESLADLAASIRQKGVIQPLIVRPRDGAEGYEIVAGERRWRAAQIAQLHDLPVLIRELTDAEVLEVAIIENIQRADLNPIEEALAFRQLMDRFGHTQEKLAEALSKSRSHIANLLRLLQLPPEVQAHLRSGALSAGHARALITTPNPAELARKVIAGGLSVRETEKLAQSAIGPTTRRKSPRSDAKDADTRALEADLSANLQMPVTISHDPGNGGGSISVRYRTLDDLDMLCRALSLIPTDLAH
jgi:ParB family transcriptional regulator, chromosome partitioning protein